MGEYAEMMLDGTCCSSCGDFMDIGGMMDGSHEPAGYATMCADCSKSERYEPRVPRFNRYAIKRAPASATNTKVACPVCSKRLKPSGVGDHVRDVHPETQTGGAA